MIDGRKIIGICLTRINEQTRAEYAGAVRDAAEALGYRVIVFNSLVDFYFDDIYDEGAKQIYEMINFDIIDGLIIFDETIHNKSEALIIIPAYDNDDMVSFIICELNVKQLIKAYKLNDHSSEIYIIAS